MRHACPRPRGNNTAAPTGLLPPSLPASRALHLPPLAIASRFAARGSACARASARVTTGVRAPTCR
eukprot:1920522-Rhodomonas_salina.1